MWMQWWKSNSAWHEVVLYIFPFSLLLTLVVRFIVVILLELSAALGYTAVECIEGNFPMKLRPGW
jgi:hypothetical protein